MGHSHHPHRAERLAAAALTMTSGLVAAGLGVAARQSLALGDRTDPSILLVAVVGGAGSLAAGWLCLAGLLSAAATLPGAVGCRAAALRDAITPALLRRVAATAIGASSTAVLLPGTAVAGPASTARQVVDAPDPSFGAATSSSVGTSPTRATPPPSPGWVPAVTATTTPSPSWSSTTAPSPAWTPERPRPTRQPGLDVLGSSPPRSADEEEEQVVVRRGDCLWDIAARSLGPGATAAQIAEAVPVWHHTNRAVIGDNPDLVVPGTTLVVPGSTRTP